MPSLLITVTDTDRLQMISHAFYGLTNNLQMLQAFKSDLPITLYEMSSLAP